MADVHNYIYIHHTLNISFILTSNNAVDTHAEDAIHAPYTLLEVSKKE
jgi:hypothetical protein